MKRTISLVLIVAMIFSIMAIGSISTFALSDGETWVVAGEAGLCGEEWQMPPSESNYMTFNPETGNYEIIYTGIAAGTYEFKVINGTNWGDDDYNLDGQANGGSNATVAVTKDNSEVTILADGIKAYVFVTEGNDSDAQSTPDEAPTQNETTGPHIDGYYQYTVTDGEANITNVDISISGDVVIPSKFGSYTVISIGAYAFSNCHNLTSITIPDSVTNIGEGAFYWCENLTSITIPDSVTSIGDCAFYSCVNLSSIVVDENNRVYDSRDNCNAIIKTDIDQLIVGCQNTIIPDSVTSIRDYAFSNRINLTSITIPDSVTNIGKEAFSYCSGLTSITIPGSVTSIGDDAFCSCYNLTSITIPDSVTSIGDSAFSSCRSLTSITIPDGVTNIGDRAFSYCSGLTSITIPDSVTSIGDSAFWGCSGLTNITIPDGVISIGDWAFEYCENLTSITIPNSVTSIGEDVFYNVNENFVIYGYEGSYAQSYAEANGLTFESLSMVPTESPTDPTEAPTEPETQEPTEALLPGYYLVGSLNGQELWSAETLTADRKLYGPTADGTYLLYYTFYLGDSLKVAHYDGKNITKLYKAEGEPNYNIGTESKTGECTLTFDPTATSGFSYQYFTVKQRTESETDFPTDATQATGPVVPGEAFDPYDVQVDISSGKFPIFDGYTTVVCYNNVGWSSLYMYCWDHATENKPAEWPGTPMKYLGIDLNDEGHRNTYISYIPDGYDMYIISNGIAGFTTQTIDLAIPDNTGASLVSNQSGKYNVSYWSPEFYEYKMPSQSEDDTTGDYTFRIFDDGTAEITEYTGSDTVITIPSTIHGYVITGIGDEAFKGCTTLTSITVPDTVTSIGDYAFSECPSLASITFPESIDSVGSCPFDDNTPWLNNLEDGVIYIGKVLYKYNGVMPENSEIVIKDGTVSISEYAFGGYSELKSITIPDSVISIGQGAFWSTGLTSVTLPDSVTLIDANAFVDCEELKSITITNPDCQIYTDSIPDYVTIYCYKNSSAHWYAELCGNMFVLLDETPTEPTEAPTEPETDSTSDYEYMILDNVTAEITEYTGSDTVITIPSNIDGYTVTSIGDRAFFKCENLTSITIPDGVTSIGDDAFSYCSGLTSITIPESVTSIGDYAFYGCSGLTSITIPDGVTSIGDLVFYDCYNLTSITIPDSVTSIGDWAFSYCSGLTSITIPDSVTSIGEYAFYYCYNLTSITIPDSVTSIGDHAFSYCSGLTSITIPDSVTSIGDHAFSYCSGLTSITIPDSVTSIGDSAFWRCSGLTSITIPDGVTSIGDSAFYYCWRLTSITIPDSVTSIGEDAFYNVNENFVIYGYEGSYAQSYAETNGFTFESLSMVPTESPTEPTETPTEPPVEKPTKVDGVTVTGVTASSIYLEWTAIENATKYWITANGKVVLSTTNSKATIKAEQDTTYELAVTALLDDGTILKLEDADKVEATTAKYSYTTSCSSTANSVTIDWTANGATKTWVYFGTSMTDLKLIGSSTGNTYTVNGLEPATTYYYKLSFLFEDGAIKTMPLATDANTEANVLGGTASYIGETMEISWNAYEGATKYWISVGDCLFSTTDTSISITPSRYKAFDFNDASVVVTALYEINGKKYTVEYDSFEWYRVN